MGYERKKENPFGEDEISCPGNLACVLSLVSNVEKYVFISERKLEPDWRACAALVFDFYLYICPFTIGSSSPLSI